ncbi:hypothetical protein DC74_8173 [Streptomyces noursei]|nr:hypothetical protein DC74_8173 [Streptomyces noursei]
MHAPACSPGSQASCCTDAAPASTTLARTVPPGRISTPVSPCTTAPHPPRQAGPAARASRPDGTPNRAPRRRALTVASPNGPRTPTSTSTSAGHEAASPQDNLRDLGAEAFAAVAEAAERGELLDTGRFAELLLRAGRLDGPALLFDAWFGEAIDTRTLAAHVGSVWSMAEYPDAALDRPAWRELFAKAGFTADGRPRHTPRRPGRTVAWQRARAPGRLVVDDPPRRRRGVRHRHRRPPIDHGAPVPHRRPALRAARPQHPPRRGRVRAQHGRADHRRGTTHPLMSVTTGGGGVLEPPPAGRTRWSAGPAPCPSGPPRCP